MPAFRISSPALEGNNPGLPLLWHVHAQSIHRAFFACPAVPTALWKMPDRKSLPVSTSERRCLRRRDQCHSFLSRFHLPCPLPPPLRPPSAFHRYPPPPVHRPKSTVHRHDPLSTRRLPPAGLKPVCPFAGQACLSHKFRRLTRQLELDPDERCQAEAVKSLPWTSPQLAVLLSPKARTKCIIC